MDITNQASYMCHCMYECFLLHVLCICNDKHAGKCLFRDGGGRYPSQTAAESQPPGNTRTSPRYVGREAGHVRIQNVKKTL